MMQCIPSNYMYRFYRQKVQMQQASQMQSQSREL
jgi:hypothetical protein